jgi:hypothetical protein
VKGANEMKYILVMNGSKADYDEYAKWSKEASAQRRLELRALNGWADYFSRWMEAACEKPDLAL